mmetsp:Transcript_14479/g.44088  ORF Transcript_14479/g.44088 Transcript_14479/m.44088 type:complete len:447 (+) Transcript_14479:610-1950(+)
MAAGARILPSVPPRVLPRMVVVVPPMPPCAPMPPADDRMPPAPGPPPGAPGLLAACCAAASSSATIRLYWLSACEYWGICTAGATGGVGAAWGVGGGVSAGGGVGSGASRADLSAFLAALSFLDPFFFFSRTAAPPADASCAAPASMDSMPRPSRSLPPPLPLAPSRSVMSAPSCLGGGGAAAPVSATVSPTMPPSSSESSSESESGMSLGSGAATPPPPRPPPFAWSADSSCARSRSTSSCRRSVSAEEVAPVPEALGAPAPLPTWALRSATTSRSSVTSSWRSSFSSSTCASFARTASTSASPPPPPPPAATCARSRSTSICAWAWADRASLSCARRLSSSARVWGSRAGWVVMACCCAACACACSSASSSAFFSLVMRITFCRLDRLVVRSLVTCSLSFSISATLTLTSFWSRLKEPFWALSCSSLALVSSSSLRSSSSIVQM